MSDDFGNSVEIRDGASGNRATVGSDGSIKVSVSSTTAPSNATSTALEKSRVIKATPGTLYGLSGFNSAAYAQYIQLHNATSLPADTAVPVMTFQVQAGQPFQLDYGSLGRAFSTGIVVCSSSTLATKTLGASADCWFDAQYA